MLKDGVAHDLQLIRNGEQGDEYEHLKYICLDKLSPKYNLVKVLMQNINAMEEPAKSPRSKKESEEPEAKDTLPIAGELDAEPAAAKPSGNIFEMTSRKIAEKNATR